MKFALFHLKKNIVNSLSRKLHLNTLSIQTLHSQKTKLYLFVIIFLSLKSEELCLVNKMIFLQFKIEFVLIKNYIILQLKY